MTILCKILSLTWWNEPKKLKSILLELLGLINNLTSSQIGIQILSTSDVTFEITPSPRVVMLTLLGDITEVKLPTVGDNQGMIIFLTNAGTDDSTVISNSEESDIWEGGVDSNTATIPQGTVMRIINDNLKYRIL